MTFGDSPILIIERVGFNPGSTLGRSPLWLDNIIV